MAEPTTQKANTPPRPPARPEQLLGDARTHPHWRRRWRPRSADACIESFAQCRWRALRRTNLGAKGRRRARRLEEGAPVRAGAQGSSGRGGRGCAEPPRWHGLTVHTGCGRAVQLPCFGWRHARVTRCQRDGSERSACSDATTPWHRRHERMIAKKQKYQRKKGGGGSVRGF